MTSEELIEIATEGKSIAERTNALTAMGTREDISPFIDTLKSACYEDIERSPAVRAHALRVISTRPDIVKYEPYMLEMIEWVMENDSCKSVKEEAKETLKAFFIPKDFPMAYHAKNALTPIEKAAVSLSIGAPFGVATFASVIDPDKKAYWKDAKFHPLYGSNWIIKGKPPETLSAKPVETEEKDETTKMYPKWLSPESGFEPE